MASREIASGTTFPFFFPLFPSFLSFWLREGLQLKAEIGTAVFSPSLGGETLSFLLSPLVDGRKDGLGGVSFSVKPLLGIPLAAR